MDVITVGGGDVIIFSETRFDDTCMCVYGGKKGGEGDEIGGDRWLLQSSVADSLNERPGREIAGLRLANARKVR